jgi:hypothetical protein
VVVARARNVPEESAHGTLVDQLAASRPSHAEHLAANGITANGITANGIAANGIAANGITANGIAANGITVPTSRAN